MRVMRVPFLFIYKLSKMKAQEFERLVKTKEFLEDIGYNGLKLDAEIVISMMTIIDQSMPKPYRNGVDYNWKDIDKHIEERLNRKLKKV